MIHYEKEAKQMNKIKSKKGESKEHIFQQLLFIFKFYHLSAEIKHDFPLLFRLWKTKHYLSLKINSLFDDIMDIATT